MVSTAAAEPTRLGNSVAVVLDGRCELRTATGPDLGAWRQLKALAPRELILGKEHLETEESTELDESRPAEIYLQEAVLSPKSRGERLWGKIGGRRQDPTIIKRNVVSALKELDPYSLSNAAKQRQTLLNERATDRQPLRSYSWGEELLSTRDREHELRQRRLFSVDPEVLRWSLEDSFSQRDVDHAHKARELFKSLVERNPVAFSEELAAQSEASYRSATEKARREFQRLTQEPYHRQSASDFLQSIHELNRQRPYFVAPSLPQKSFAPDETSRRKQLRVWDVEASLFAQRKKENDSRGIYDSDKTLSKQFELDWERIVSKSRFHRLVGREDVGVRLNDQGLHQELDEIKEELHKKRDVLRMAFVYYSMRNGPSTSGCVFQLSLSQWTTFAHECNVLDAKSVGVKSTDLVRMFVSTNFEEDSRTEEAEANDDDALVRFEFLEILVRASFGKYISSKQLNDSSDSVQKLLEEDIIPSLPSEAMVDPNRFRREHFYTAPMEKLVKHNFDFLTAVFKLYKAKDKTKYFAIEHWMTFMESAALLGTHTGIERREAKLVFAWSQMAVIDELKKRHRAVSLLFYDFLEALARVAEMLLLPSEAEMRASVPNAPEISIGALVFSYFSTLKESPSDAEMQSREARAAQPLHDRFELLLLYLVEALRAVWGGNTRDQLTDRMKKMASRLSGGIELG